MKRRQSLPTPPGRAGACRLRSRKKSGGTDFCFVVMPYAWPKMPSPATGLLQSILERDGLRARSLYGNILFWDQVGYERFDLVSKSLETLFWAGSWTFAHIAFPDFHPDDEAFLEEVYARYGPAAGADLARFRGDMLSIRESAERFIHDLAERILAEQARIVGCSVTFQSQHVSSLALLRHLREIAPDVVTVMGGSNCETVMGLATHKCFPWVDYVVSGEADEIITPLTRRILERGRDVPADDLPDAVFAPVHRRTGYHWDADRQPDDVPRATAGTLAGLPAPNYDDFFSDFNASSVVRRSIIPGLAYETSRGCWWGRCTFCGLNGCGRTYRSKPAEQVLRDLDFLSRRYRMRSFETVDNILEMDYFSSLIPELIRAGAPYNLFFETKSSLTRTHFDVLHKAGVRWIQPGIESLNSNVLKLMRKGSKAYQNLEILKWSRQYGIRMQWAILFDFPGEKDEWYEEMAELLPLLFHLNPPFGFIPIHYHRYSHYFRQAKEYGLELLVPELLRYVYPVPTEDLRNLVYEFDEESRENLRKSPVISALLSRSGVEAMTAAFLEWRKFFWSKDRPMLGMTVAEDEVRIRDTRPAAVRASFRLAGLERDVYLACEEARKPVDLYKMFVAGRITPKRVDAVLRRFVKHRLMVHIDGRVLGLAVREPCGEFLGEEDFPGGALRDEFRKGGLRGLLTRSSFDEGEPG